MSYPYKHSDLENDPLNQKYKFRGIDISKKAYDLIRRMICDEKKDVDLWVLDVDGTRHDAKAPPEEIAMVDGMFTWGFTDWDDDDFGKVDLGPCKWPQWHDFKKEAYTTWYFRECKKCGYSPELDHNKPDFAECHKEFMEWEKRQKT